MRAIRQCLILVSCLTMFASPAWADHADHSLAKPSNRAAREHLEEGNRLYLEGKWEEAMEEYQAGARSQDAPVFDYNLGQCHRKRGEYQAALIYYDRFLTKGQPEGDVLAAVQAFQAEMRAQLANRALTMPPSEPEPATSRDETTHIVPRSVPQPERPAVDVAAPKPSDQTSSNWLGWTTLGIGSASMGVAGYLFFRGAAMNDAANSEPDTRERNDLRDGAKTRNLLGMVTGVAGIALATTGIIVLVTHRHESGRGASVSLGILGQGIAMLGQF